MNEPNDAYPARSDVYIKKPDLIVRGIYKLKARNLVTGVWDGKAFLGSRSKFDSTFVDSEFHWDDDHGCATVQPKTLIGMLDVSVALDERIPYTPPNPRPSTIYGFDNVMLRYALSEAYKAWLDAAQPASMSDIKTYDGETEKRRVIKTSGIMHKYVVLKGDGTPKEEGAEYFVLRLDEGGSDKRHISACRDAIITYALRIRDHLPKLAEELLAKYGKDDAHG